MTSKVGVTLQKHSDASDRAVGTAWRGRRRSGGNRTFATAYYTATIHGFDFIIRPHSRTIGAPPWWSLTCRQTCPLLPATGVITFNALRDARDWLRNKAASTEFTKGLVRVRFTPQAWQRDQAIPHPELGDAVFEVPVHDVQDAHGRWLSDKLRRHVNAPTWIREWEGPYEIQIEHGLT